MFFHPCKFSPATAIAIMLRDCGSLSVIAKRDRADYHNEMDDKNAIRGQTPGTPTFTFEH